MSKRDYRLLLEDILDAIEKIQSYTKDKTFDTFVSDNKTLDAVIRNIEIIGEASNRIPKNIQEKHNEIEWHKLISIRNRIIHEYFGVDYEIVWQIITQNINELKISINHILNTDSPGEKLNFN
jgi:uncharacterized protein with HEPN domain